MIKHDIFYSLNNYELHSQIEAETEVEANKALLAFLKWLEANGAEARQSNRSGSNYRKSYQRPQESQQTVSDGEVSSQVCPTHGKARAGQNGTLYCPSKLQDGSWCKWRASNGKVAVASL